MAEKVGGIYYEVDLDTSKMVDGQRRASRELDGLSTRLTATGAAVAILAAMRSFETAGFQSRVVFWFDN